MDVVDDDDEENGNGNDNDMLTIENEYSLKSEFIHSTCSKSYKLIWPISYT